MNNEIKRINKIPKEVATTNTLLITVVSTITIIIAIDFIGFCFWIASNQIPVDNFFIGVITKTILSIIIL